MKNDSSFDESYLATFAGLGIRLKDKDKVAESRVSKAEARLNVRLPKALRDFCLIAGRERHINRAHNFLLPPEEWETHNGKLIFLQENQGVVVWGVTTTRRMTLNPPVFIAANEGNDTYGEWHREHRNCSIFLRVMLYWNATYGGGLKHTATVAAPNDLINRLDKNWDHIGEVNGMQAFGRDGKALCHVEWADFDGNSAMTIFAGAAKKSGLSEIATELGVAWNGDPAKLKPS